VTRSLMVRRIKKHRLFEGLKKVSNKEAVQLINSIKRKKIGHSCANGKLHAWMSELGFRKKWIGGRSRNARIWWIREA